MLKKTKLIYVSAAIIFRILLDLLYRDTITQNYSYFGLTYAPTQASSLISWTLLIGGIFMSLPFVESKKVFISHIAILFFTMFYIPWTSYIYNNPQPLDFIATETIYWALFLFFLYISSKVNLFNFAYKIPSQKILYVMSFIMIGTIIYISGRYTNFRIELSLDTVYDWRMEARTFKMPILLEYVWAGAVNLLPVIVFYCLTQKKWYFATILSLVIIMSFSINGSKSTLFKLILCIFLYFSTINHNFKEKSPIYLCGFALICYAQYYFSTNTFLSELVIRRVFFIPSQLDGYYYEIINKFDPIYFTHKLNGHEITFYVGDIFFGKDYMRANNGLFSDAYMNLGALGCVVYPIVYAILFNACESLFKGVDIRIKFYIIFIIVFTMRSSELTTALLTHGLFLLCVVTPFFRTQPDEHSQTPTSTNKINF